MNAYIGSDDLGGRGKTFFFFIPKFHILATRGKKIEFFPFLDTFRLFRRTSLLKRKKMNKTSNLRLVHTYLEFGLRFFIFSQERLNNLKKLTKKRSKKGTKVGCTFSQAVRARWQANWPK